ncbi:RNA methyltransferase [Acholeplasma sp. OttesenSCG-928-E16]|nr:RNA methyltransferase [Acholeplasma sp. OttesenSCG-928-E16]
MISSKQNQSFKTWMKLKTKKYRDIYNLFLVFGDDLIEKAREYDAILEIVTNNKDKEGVLISDELMKLIQENTTFDSFAVCKKVEKDFSSNRVLILDDIQDPTNLGTLLRSAAAFSFMNVYISKKSCDLYHEKTIRSSKGAIFDVDVKRVDLIKQIDILKNSDFMIVCAEAHESSEVNIDRDQKLALVLGNEGQGVSNKIKEMCHYSYTIETKNVESLNVAAAGAILMHLWRGQ